MSYIWLSAEDIRNYLVEKGGTESSKDSELLTALMLNKFCEKQWRVDCHIGLELSGKYEREIKKKEVIDFKKLEEFIEKMTEEATPVDIAIGKKIIENNKIPSALFQIKRFGKDPKKKSTNDLIEYLNDLKRQYAKANMTRLVIVLETDQELDFNLIKQKLNTKDFPFHEIMLIGKVKNELNFYGVYPQCGMESISLSEFF